MGEVAPTGIERPLNISHILTSRAFSHHPSRHLKRETGGNQAETMKRCDKIALVSHCMKHSTQCWSLNLPLWWFAEKIARVVNVLDSLTAMSPARKPGRRVRSEREQASASILEVARVCSRTSFDLFGCGSTSVFDQLSNVLDFPGCDSRAEFDTPRKSAGMDTRPPRRSRDWKH